MTFSQTYLQRMESNNTKKQVTPDYQLINPLDKEIFVTGIVLVPDSYFQLKGKAIVQINGVVVFDEADSETFKDVNELPIALTQKILGRAQKIEIWVWNGTDSDTVALTANIKLSENQDETFASIKAVDSKTQKDNVSDFESLFPKLNRGIGEYTKTIDTKGYKKLIVLLSKPEPNVYWSVTHKNGSNPETDAPSSYDGKLATKTSTPDTTAEQIFKADFVTIQSRHYAIKHEYRHNTNGTQTITYSIEKSNDGINWSVVLSGSEVWNLNSPSTRIRNYDLGIHTARFIRIRTTQAVFASGNDGTANYEIYDKNTMGGTGSLSFEILNSVNRWVEYIPSSEFATISEESNDVVRQIGDVTTKSISGLTYILPSTQTKFRAKYTITDGGLTNAVDIMRVS